MKRLLARGGWISPIVIAVLGMMFGAGVPQLHDDPPTCSTCPGSESAAATAAAKVCACRLIGAINGVFGE